MTIKKLQTIIESTKFENITKFNRVLLISTVFLMVFIISIPVESFATLYESQQAVDSTNTISGVKGSLTVKSPYVSTTGFFNDHRDYIVYLNLPTSSTMGAGWTAYKDGGGSVAKYDLVYYYHPNYGVVHNLYSTLTTGTTFTAYAYQLTSSTSNCWRGSTYSNAADVCFPSGSYPANIAGNLARAKTEFSSGTNDMPGYFNELKTGRWISGSIQYNKYFSEDVAGYKCYSKDTSTTNSYVLDQLANLSGSGSNIDRVGSGPRTYTVDDCSGDNQGWTAYGE